MSKDQLLDDSSSDSDFSAINGQNKKTDLNYVAVLPSAAQYDPAAPAVLLFGWAGCQDRNLAKYSEIYEQIGCTTFRYTSPMAQFFPGVGDKGQQVAAALCSAVHEELDIGGSPSVLVHTFSNNGARLLANVLKEMDSKTKYTSLRSKIRGIVFDCGPAESSLWTFSRATVHTVRPRWSGWRHYLASAVCVAVFGVGVAFHSLYRLFTAAPSLSNEHAGLWSLIDQLPLRQTFLYSKADQMCPYLSIEKFIAEQKCRSDRKQIESQCFPLASHCDLLRAHPGEYRKALSQMVIDLKTLTGSGKASTASTPPLTEDGFETVDATRL